MNYKEAIEILISHYPSGDRDELKEAYNLAILALQKQIPTSPIKNEWSPSECPSCGSELSDFIGDGLYKDRITLKTCECGQYLNWKK